MAIAASIPPIPQRVIVSRRELPLLLSAALASVLVMALLEPEAQSVALPMLALANLSLLFVVALWKRDGVLPVFELGTVVVITTTLYSLFPLLNFLAGGLRWTVLSDSRLLYYNSTPEEVGAFAWRHVLYLTSFVVVYLVVRGRAVVRNASLTVPDRATTTAIVVLLLALVAYFWLLQVAFDFSYSGSYAKDTLAGMALLMQLPYFVQQISHNLQGVVLILKQCVLALLLQRWRMKKWRYVLVAWLLVEVIVSVLRMGSRSEMAFLLLSATLLYHRLVRPLTFQRVILVGAIFNGGLLLFGAIRAYSWGIGEVLAGSAPLLAASNEFQVLFGTAYDLYMRKSIGSLGEVPWQLYVSDLYMLIPSQLLPFYKWDPSEWYLEVIGFRGTGIGLMFGVVSQAIIGLDWVELALRGALLGGVCAWVHRWYVRRASKFWVTLLYLFLCVWAYYSFRASSFYFMSFVVYQFVPTVLLVHFSRELLRRMSQGVGAKER